MILLKSQNIVLTVQFFFNLKTLMWPIQDFFKSQNLVFNSLTVQVFFLNLKTLLLTVKDFFKS